MESEQAKLIAPKASESQLDLNPSNTYSSNTDVLMAYNGIKSLDKQGF